jgi:hypothetical protein
VPSPLFNQSMGGPSSIVIVETEPGPQERLNLEELLQRLGTRPFGVSWVVGELYEGEDEDHPTWRSDVATHFAGSSDSNKRTGQSSLVQRNASLHAYLERSLPSNGAE